MSRIGKKPIPLPKGVTYAVEGNTVRVKGPKGEVVTHMPGGVKLEQNDGNLVVVREDDSKAAIQASFALWSTIPSKASPRAGRGSWISSASAIAPR